VPVSRSQVQPSPRGLLLGQLSSSPRSGFSLSYVPNLSWIVRACGKSEVERG
jgi:hypothetical protein